MPNFKKPATSGRPVKKYNSAGGSKPGSRSEGHRGFHADAAPAKKRWNADDRAKRAGDRPTGNDRRPNWNDHRSDQPWHAGCRHYDIA